MSAVQIAMLAVGVIGGVHVGIFLAADRWRSKAHPAVRPPWYVRYSDWTDWLP